MNNLLLSAKGIHKTYLLGKRTLEVLRGVDLELDRGDFLALRGASGAGKSTLLYLLGGLDTPNQGEIRLAGRNLASLSRRELARLRTEEWGSSFKPTICCPSWTHWRMFACPLAWRAPPLPRLRHAGGIC